MVEGAVEIARRGSAVCRRGRITLGGPQTVLGAILERIVTSLPEAESLLRRLGLGATT